MNSKSTPLCIHSAYTVRMMQQTMVLGILGNRIFLEDNFAFCYEVVRRYHFRKPQCETGKGSYHLQMKLIEEKGRKYIKD